MTQFFDPWLGELAFIPAPQTEADQQFRPALLDQRTRVPGSGFREVCGKATINATVLQKDKIFGYGVRPAAADGLKSTDDAKTRSLTPLVLSLSLPVILSHSLSPSLTLLLSLSLSLFLGLSFFLILTRQTSHSSSRFSPRAPLDCQSLSLTVNSFGFPIFMGPIVFSSDRHAAILKHSTYSYWYKYESED